MKFQEERIKHIKSKERYKLSRCSQIQIF